jgi:hypothetical protein
MTMTWACNPPGIASANHKGCAGYTNNGDLCECKHHEGDTPAKLTAAVEAVRAIRARNAEQVQAFLSD